MRTANFWTAETIRKESAIELAFRLDLMAKRGETPQRVRALREAARRLRLAYTFKKKEDK